MIAVLTFGGGEGSIQAGDLEVGETRGWTVALHIQEPRNGRGFRRHAEGFSQCGGEWPTRSDINIDFEFLAFVVSVSKGSQIGRFGLVLEKGIVEGPIIDVDRPHFWIDAGSIALSG